MIEVWTLDEYRRYLRGAPPVAIPVQPTEPSPSFSLVLPYPPSGNTLYTQVGTQRYLRQRQRDYRRAVQEAVKAQWFTIQPRPAWPLQGRLSVTLWCYRADRRKADLDNVLKVVGDALQHAGVYADDSHIDTWHVYRGTRREVACVEVAIACECAAEHVQEKDS